MNSYAAYYDNEIRINSSSGGVFYIIASCFDVVYGVAMDEDCYGASFKRIDDGQIEALQGAKYLQAKVGNIFVSVQNDLREGKQVLFSGTGCQINGLKNYLKKDYSNLTTVDVICHGTPSPKLWREYLMGQETKKEKIEKVNFRCKENGWQNYGRKENQTLISQNVDAYMKMFLRNYCLRPSCYECLAKIKKSSDLTIGDFWGIDTVAPEMNDDKGVSLVITRTDKGDALFESLKKKLVWKEVDYDSAVKYNPAEYKSMERPKERNVFFQDLNMLSFPEMVEKYAKDLDVPLYKKVISKIKNSLNFLRK